MSRLKDMTTLGPDLAVNVTMVVNILYILCFTDESPRGDDYSGILPGRQFTHGS